METDEELETGYGPATRPGDNLCNDYAQGLADGARSLAEGRGHRTGEDSGLGLSLVDGGSPSEFVNMAVARRPLDEDEWRAAASSMARFFGGRPGGPYLLFSAWPTPALSGFGFGRIGHPPLMVRPPGPLPSTPVAGLEIRPVEDGRAALDWERTFIDGFPEPSLNPLPPGCMLPEQAVHAPGWRHWVGYVDGSPVATASSYVAGTHVDVAYVATLPPARGRGIGAALTAHATLADPSLPAMLLASDPGRSVYERLGYRAVLRFTLWAGHRSASDGDGPA